MANKVLIVDDEPFNLDLLEQELADQGYSIERAVDGEEALKKVESFLPDVILLDYMMPRMNGIEVVTRLRQDERHKSLPVILVTAKGSQEDKIRGLDAGADDYVVKPFDSFELLARVRSMLRIKQLHDALDEWNRNLEGKVIKQVAEIERISRLKRYLSPQVAETLLQSEESALFKNHRREITVVFLDLRGFTAFSDSAEPEEVMELLRGYHAEMGKLVFKFEGTLERFAGDGIMIFFNDPIACDDHTERAVRMAVEMRAKAQELRAGWLKRGFDLDLGIGLAASYATLGNIGFEGRMDYGAVGNVTNLASRLCDDAKGGQIVTNQKTLSKVEQLVEAESLGELNLKGFFRPISAFNIIRLRE
ncbi:MAG: guanylate cyclase [Deltaproteobacteria bacterium RIFCSPLOWO2_12_FULL_60_19]|nr:MAG: guanylate cyclase [Deltaproteobacteria bacterium RIFCSPLOWO2_12_FULL_60_19]